MIRDRPLSDEENTWLKIIIPDLFVFGTELHHLNRRDPETHQRAVMRRLQEHVIYCKIRAVRIHLAGMRQLTLGHNHREARVDGAEARLDPQRRGSSTRRLTELAKLKIYNSSRVVAPMVEPVSEDRQAFICSSTTLQRRIEHATAWCTKSTRR